MDPLSAAFAAYLNTISGIVTQTMQSQNNHDIQVHSVEHDGYEITYAHRMWIVQERMVCADYRQDLTRYSGCTKAAQDWFRVACRHLQENPKQDWSYPKLKAMYCSAAATFQPTIASIEWTEADDNDVLVTARQACSLARVELFGDNRVETRRRKDEACRRYTALKGQQTGHHQ
jgi:hypothetical protein